MTSDEPTSARPVPKPPATGADAWKNTPTSCWPTPASMAKAREHRAPLDPGYGDRTDRSAGIADAFGDDPAADLDRVDADDDATADAEASERDRTDERPSLADDPRVPERFRDTVRRLDDVPERPVTEHAETYDAVHRDLRQALDGIERTG